MSKFKLTFWGWAAKVPELAALIICILLFLRYIEARDKTMEVLIERNTQALLDSMNEDSKLHNHLDGIITKMEGRQ